MNVQIGKVDRGPKVNGGGAKLGYKNTELKGLPDCNREIRPSWDYVGRGTMWVLGIPRDTGILYFSEQKAVNPAVIDTWILCFSEQTAVMVNTIIFQ